MIIKGKQPTALKQIPFRATIEGDEDDDQTISFSEGKIFDCFNSTFPPEEDDQNSDDDDSFSNGAVVYSPTNMQEEFEYQDGDQFYLRVDRENSSIVKTDEPEDGDILIWKDDTQFLSENVFLQEIPKKKISFTPTLLEVKEDGSKRYRMNGGFVNVFNKGFSRLGGSKKTGATKFISSFEYTVKEDESDPFFYIQIAVRITKKSEEQTLYRANRVYIEDFEIMGITLIQSEEEILQQEKEDSKAYVGQSCKKKGEEEEGEEPDLEEIGNDLGPTAKSKANPPNFGLYWIKLPSNGNIDVCFDVINHPEILLQATPSLLTDSEANPDVYEIHYEAHAQMYLDGGLMEMPYSQADYTAFSLGSERGCDGDDRRIPREVVEVPLQPFCERIEDPQEPEDPESEVETDAEFNARTQLPQTLTIVDRFVGHEEGDRIQSQLTLITKANVESEDQNSRANARARGEDPDFYGVSTKDIGTYSTSVQTIDEDVFEASVIEELDPLEPCDGHSALERDLSFCDWYIFSEREPYLDITSKLIAKTSYIELRLVGGTQEDTGTQEETES
tara:strand:+ start:3565 stop:5244 length:1680 start_codon:yes stop_codon:yes gene_type:complete